MNESSQSGAVVVTGAGSGIGREITRLLLEQGTPVSAWDVNPGDLAGHNSANLMVRTLDTRDKAALEKATAETIERFGSISGAATCAGIFRPKPFLELTQQDWDDHFGINLRGVLFTCQAVLPHMLERKKGSLVLFSSTLARSTKPRTGHYAATKGGVLGLMRVMALETAKEGIRVNAISPGIADTPMPNAIYEAGTMADRAKANPMGRIGTANDMAQTALFLLSDDASYVTGQDFRVNGGQDPF
jgi:2-hydroxycyclohexanecarboxyl-CoA dehydrogenase